VGIIGLVTSIGAVIGTIVVAYIQSKTSAKVAIAEARASAAEKDLAEMKGTVDGVVRDLARLSSVLGIAIKYAHELRADHPHPGSWPVDLYPYV